MSKNVATSNLRSPRRGVKLSPKAPPKPQVPTSPRRPIDLKAIKQIPVLHLSKLKSKRPQPQEIQSSRDSSRKRRSNMTLNLSMVNANKSINNSINYVPKPPTQQTSFFTPRSPRSISLSASTARAKRERSASSRKNSNKQESIRAQEEIMNFPMSAAQAIRMYGNQLSPYEQAEILDYKQVYFLGLQAQKVPPKLKGGFNHGFDNEKSDYKLIKNDHVSFRYETLKLLGTGSFGQVAMAFDHKTREMVALKVIKNKEKFHTQGKVEVKALRNCLKHDMNESNHIIHIKDNFVFRNHLVITFELLSINLYEFLKENSFQGLSSGLIRRFAVQLLGGLIQMSSLGIIHCDLKPENILLKAPNKSGIKIIDLGSACYSHERIYTYIQSRFYRAPEIILGIPYTTKIDMWSFGCIMVELFTGYPLYPGESEQEQIQLITQVVGLPPSELLAMSPRKKLFFDRNGDIIITENSRGKRHIPASKPLKSIVNSRDLKFLDFVTKCLEWIPEQRLSPMEAMQHEWIQECMPKPPDSKRDSSVDTGRTRRPSVQRTSTWNSPRNI